MNNQQFDEALFGSQQELKDTIIKMKESSISLDSVTSQHRIRAYELTRKMGGITRSQRIHNSIVAVELLLENIEMYKGDLNPKWKFWNGVLTELKSM